MTQEQKELILKDLCSRLPYGVKVEVNYGDAKYAPSTPSKIDVANKKLVFNFDIPIQHCKPYLRPMSSMTEEELYEVQGIVGKGVEIRDGFFNIVYSSIKRLSYAETQAVFDWLNTHHFDYRGLIPMGLAIEVTEKNNPYK